MSDHVQASGASIPPTATMQPPLSFLPPLLLGLTQLAGVPVKVSPHRSLNVSRGVIRSRVIASCNVEEIVEELRPQGVTAAEIIHVRDGDSKRRTNTVILTFASHQPPKHITAGYMRVPVELLYSESSSLFQLPKTLLHV